MGGPEEVFFKEGDFKRQKATTTGTTVHITLFYCKEKITSQVVFIYSSSGFLPRNSARCCGTIVPASAKKRRLVEHRFEHVQREQI